MARKGWTGFGLVGLILTASVTVPSFGCRSVTGCDRETQVIEAPFIDGFYEIALDIVADYRSRDYTCTQEPMRNGAGATVGERYTCTGCR